MLKVLSVFGTRPEAVKMAPVIQALTAAPAVKGYVCVTAQHRQMLDQVLSLFNIVPDYDLDLMQPDQSLAQLTANILHGLDPVLKNLKPDWVLVQGDTTTVMAASLLAFYHGIRVGHIEAGLRTGDKYQPFPEEINRRLTSVVADLHFAPTRMNRRNLLREGVPPGQILVTGNPVVDALQHITAIEPPPEVISWLAKWGVLPRRAARDGLEGRQLVLVTAHRRENFGEPLEEICRALRALAEVFAERICIVYPVHLNPNVQRPVHQILDGVKNIVLLPPLDYLPLVHLMRGARLVLTDSGGIQEEATALGVPTLVLRRVTERPEGIEAGVLKLVGTDSQNIFNEARALLEDVQKYRQMAQARNPFGDGRAAGRVVQALLDYHEPDKIILAELAE